MNAIHEVNLPHYWFWNIKIETLRESIKKMWWLLVRVPVGPDVFRQFSHYSKNYFFRVSNLWKTWPSSGVRYLVKFHTAMAAAEREEWKKTRHRLQPIQFTLLSSKLFPWFNYCETCEHCMGVLHKWINILISFSLNRSVGSQVM